MFLKLGELTSLWFSRGGFQRLGGLVNLFKFPKDELQKFGSSFDNLNRFSSEKSRVREIF